MKYLRRALLLGVVAAFGSVAVPNFLVARNRSAQKRTMGDIRTAATAWEARATDRNSYLVGKAGVVSFDQLRQALEPTYVKHLSRTDGWNNALVFTSSDQEYSIRAVGSDHRAEAVVVPGTKNDFASDIIYSNGSFITYPEGI